MQVDVLYLHNAAEMQLTALGEAAFFERLRAAFKWLEGARSRGTIRAYGMATWDCFRRAPGAGGYVRLRSVVELAEEVGGKDHGFRWGPVILAAIVLFCRMSQRGEQQEVVLLL